MDAGVGWGSISLSLASLGVVCLVAWGALRLLAGKGVGKATGAVKVLARCPLEPRRAVYVIEAGGKCLLVGVGEGPMTVLAELDGERVRAEGATPAPGSRFADVLARVMRREQP
jgi:flagellar biosynthetic protein FliO